LRRDRLPGQASLDFFFWLIVATIFCTAVIAWILGDFVAHMFGVFGCVALLEWRDHFEQ
jgi:hypothetical protein